MGGKRKLTLSRIANLKKGIQSSKRRKVEHSDGDKENVPSLVCTKVLLRAQFHWAMLGLCKAALSPESWIIARRSPRKKCTGSLRCYPSRVDAPVRTNFLNAIFSKHWCLRLLALQIVPVDSLMRMIRASMDNKLPGQRGNIMAIVFYPRLWWMTLNRQSYLNVYSLLISHSLQLH